MSELATPLTSLGGGGGCGCKIAAPDLLPIIRDLVIEPDARLRVGSATADDAAVFAIRDDLALVQTLDFFPPPVDDPYDFGRIAAANALSDVYAMGGMPLTAMNIVAFPLEILGGDVLRAILQGGADACAEAGATVVGGHSIRDEEPKYGLSVTGLLGPEGPITNAGGRPGDVLVLSKPLGVGAVVAAHRRGDAGTALLATATAVMSELNARAATAARAAGVSAMTDVTGFGLLGHLHHMCRESGLSARLEAAAVPAIDGVHDLLEDGAGVSGGARRNGEWAESFTAFSDDVAGWRRRLVCDPTTSGGLLMAVARERAAELPGAVVGRLEEGAAGEIRVS